MKHKRAINIFGNKIVQEDETNSSLGDITDIFLTNNGSGYSLPTVSVSSSGSKLLMF